MAKSGPKSIKYAAHTRYTGGKFFYFRKDEALKSLKDFTKYVDMLAEIILDGMHQKILWEPVLTIFRNRFICR